MLAFQTTPDSAFAIVDLTRAYAEPVEKAVRGVAMLPGRRAVLVQDEVELSEPCELTWGMTTEAEIAIAPDGSAELESGGKKLLARVLEPGGATFSVESAEQEPPQKRNEGVRRLLLRTGQVNGRVRIAVQLAPVWPDTGAATPPDLKPLSEW